MSDQHMHVVCFSGPEDPAALIEAGEEAGFKFEFGNSEPDQTLAGEAVRHEETRQRLDSLLTRLADRRGEPSD